MGTMTTVVVDDEGVLPQALAIVQAEIAEIDRVCSRFRVDSELSRLNDSGEGEAVVLSALLEDAIAAALAAARMTGGLVDPTVGRALHDIGYTVTFSDVPSDGPALRLTVRPVAGWQAVDYDPLAHTVSIPADVSLDLGASGKAWAADRAASAVAEGLGISVAVDCGGDIAVRGPLHPGGWPVRVGQRIGGDDWQDVVVFDGGLATSGTEARRWRRGGVDIHHIIDPATGLPARTPWSMVSVAAASCLEANAAATAAIILGDAAPGWLEDLRLPARLVDKDGWVRFAGGWRETC
ncbi:MAG: FAD:protein FMN transferase [Candidatus Dormibacteraeota bacterium]|uniref:FAD:protein FMN transferase n=2 Tax=Candidatus Aeolococcus gillhamiae TaxID=3127015 RepID=A0A934N0R9_9BACT|nr:FAD:protein FMN transferase [Candidatus Dormibacteraeota bacterium]